MDPMALIEALKDPQMRHAIMVHMPIALSMLGVLLAIVSLILGGRSRALAWTTTVAYVLLAGSAYLAMLSGEDAHDVLNIATPAVNELVNEHEEMAEWVWIFAAVIAVILVVASVTKEKVRAGAAAVALIGGLFTAGWVSLTADHGGRLVYEHGAGTPNPGAAASAEDGHEHDEGEAGEHDEGGEAPPPDDPRLVHFRETVKPVLEQQCIKCHNPVRKNRVAGLDQTTMRGLLEGGMSGPGVVPGNPDESWIIMAVRHEVEDLEMPPSGEKLPDEVIADLEQWVRDGAVWEPLQPAPPRDNESGEASGEEAHHDGDDDGEAEAGNG